MSNTYIFNNQELKLIDDFNEAKVLRKVFYHFFVNLAIPEQKLVLIDTVEMVFDNNKTIFFKINEDENGFNVSTENNYEVEKKEIESISTNVLSFSRIDVSQATIWKDKINTPLITISPEIDTDFWGGNYLVINFALGAVEVNFDKEKGLIVELYEMEE